MPLLRFVALISVTTALLGIGEASARAENMPAAHAEAAGQAPRLIDVGELYLELGALSVPRVWGTSHIDLHHYAGAVEAVIRSLDRVSINVSTRPSFDATHVGDSRLEQALARGRSPMLTPIEGSFLGAGALAIVAQLVSNRALGAVAGTSTRTDLVVIPGGLIARGRF